MLVTILHHKQYYITNDFKSFNCKEKSQQQNLTYSK